MWACSFKIDDLNSRKAQTFATISIAAVFLVIGIPIWLKTTEVRRAQLPFHEIANLNQGKTLLLQIDVNLAGSYPDIVIFKERLAEMLNHESVHNYHERSSIQFAYKVDVRDPKVILDDVHKLENSGHDVSIQITEKSNVDTHAIHVDSNRLVRCVMPQISDELELKDALDQLVNLIRHVLVNEILLIDVAKQVSDEDRKMLRNTPKLQKMTSAGSKLELLFSLLISENENKIFKWNIQHAVQSYIHPFLKQLEHIFEFNVGSQVLFSNTLSYKSKLERDESANLSYHSITQAELSQVVNNIESRLGSQVSSDPTLNFVVYNVGASKFPLNIKLKNGDLSKSNSFLVPRWGAMILSNQNSHDDSDELNAQPFMDIFLGYLRVLLGLSNDMYFDHDDSIHFQAPSKGGVALWEIDFLSRLRTLENIVIATHTLQSLSTLLNNISNIVINDNVAKEVYLSVTAVEEATAFLANGSLMEALNSSKKAFIASETAFFDPTLLELLYFPEDQKFAIYVPLFLPVCLPLLMSIVVLIKRVKDDRIVNKDT